MMVMMMITTDVDDNDSEDDSDVDDDDSDDDSDADDGGNDGGNVDDNGDNDFHDNKYRYNLTYYWHQVVFQVMTVSPSAPGTV